MARSTDGKATSRIGEMAIKTSLVSEPTSTLGGNRDSQTVWVGSRPGHLGARIGQRHASLRGTGSAEGR